MQTFERKIESQLETRSLFSLLPGIQRIRVDLVDIGFDGAKYGKYNSSPTDLFFIAAIAKFLEARLLLEFGTSFGLATLQMAVNTPEDAVITTVDLPAEVLYWSYRTHLEGESDGSGIVNIGGCFKYNRLSSKIQQLRADSRTFDFTKLEKSFDFVYVDGDHSEAGVTSDSKNALDLLAPGGCVLWHNHDLAGVDACLRNLQNEVPIYHIEHSELAIYVRDAE